MSPLPSKATQYSEKKSPTLGDSCCSLMAILLIAAAGYFFFTTISALIDYGIRVLYADQWRIYTDYFSNPFPANLLTLQNGHRPIISGLFFLLDRYLFGARQNFLLALGALLAISTAGAMVWPFLRNRSIPFLHKVIAFYITITAIFWLGNSRELFHGNESVHAYLVTFFFLAAVNSLSKCQATAAEETAPNKTLWCLWACFFSLLALFSFGAGIAVPPTLLAMAFLLRLSKATKSILLVNILFVIVLYLLLPSAPKVAGVLISSAHRIKGLSNFFSLLGAPLIFLVGGPESVSLASLERFKSTICPIVGMAGSIILVWRTLSYYRREKPLDKSEATPIAMLLLTAGAVFLVIVMRTEYFTAYPDQIFANRYLIWTTLFWASLGLEFLNFSRTTQNVQLKKISIAAIIFFSLVSAIVIQFNNRRWLAHIEKWQNKTRSAAVGLIIGVHDQQGVEQDLMESADKIFSLADKLREERLNIFSGPIAQAINRNVKNSFTTGTNTKFSAQVIIERTFTDQVNQTLAARVNIQAGMTDQQPIDYILVANQADSIIGATVLQSHRQDKTIPPYMHFSGYIKNYSPEITYRLYGIMNQSTVAFPITVASPVTEHR